jgi:hypothetical protein
MSVESVGGRGSEINVAQVMEKIFEWQCGSLG